MQLVALEKEINSPAFQSILKKLAKYEDRIAEALDFDKMTNYVQNLSEREFYTEMVGIKVESVLEQLTADVHDPYDIFKSSTKLNELGNPIDVLDNQVSVAAAGKTPSESGGITGVVTNLLSSLTEGGSPIGILHLILDIVGIIGDAVFVATGFPLGTVADFLNAMIYFYRGPSKYLLGVISLIAAFVPFGGDILKGFKGSVKHLAKPFSKVTNKGAGKVMSREAAEALTKVGPKEFKQAHRSTEYIKKSTGRIGSSMMGAVSSISKNVIAKVVGFIPLIGKYLKTFFTKLGNKTKNIADNLGSFSKSYDEVSEVVMKGEMKSSYEAMSTILKTGDGTITKQANHIVIKQSDGIIKKMPIDKFKQFAQLEKKFPKNTDLGKIIHATDDSMVKFYNHLATDGHAAGIAIKNMRRVGKIHTGKIKYFIVKSVIRLLTGGQNMEGFEKDSIGNILTNGEIMNRRIDIINKDRKDSGALQTGHYADLQTKDGREFTRLMYCELVMNAKMTGLPPIASNTNTPEDCFGDNTFRAYNYQVAKQQDEEAIAEEFFGNSLSKEEMAAINNMPTLESVTLKHIKPFSKF